MKLRTTAALPAFFFCAGSAFAQPTPMAGSYELASIYDLTQDNVKHDTWGSGAKGLLILTPSGQFAVSIEAAGRDKTASKSPRTPVGPIVAYCGTYTVDDGGKSLTYHVTISSFPSWDGIDRKAVIESTGDTEIALFTTVKGDAVLGDFTAHQVWKRIH